MFAVSIGFTRVPDLPLPGDTALPDVVFGVLVAAGLTVAVVTRMRPPAGWRLRPIGLDVAVAGWTGAVALSGAVHGEAGEIAVAVYLAAVYAVVRAVLAWLPEERAAAAVVDAFVAMGVVHAVLGIAGWVLSAAFHDDVLSSWPWWRYYPGIGHLGRASGSTTTPNMLAGLLTVPWVLLAARLAVQGWRRRDGVLVALVSVSMVLTFSKTLMIAPVAAVVVVCLAGRAGRRRVLLGTAAAGCVLALLAGTHVWVHRDGDRSVATMQASGIGTSVRLWSVGGWRVSALNYLETKEAAVRLGWRHPVLGVGPGRFPDELGPLRQEGTYDAGLPSYEPHSTYLGTFAELGVVGVVALGGLAVAAAGAARRAVRTSGPAGPRRVAAVGLAGVLVATAVEAVSTDVAHFRFTWLALAAVAALSGSMVPHGRPEAPSASWASSAKSDRHAGQRPRTTRVT